MTIEKIMADVEMKDIFNSIEETILLADLDYKICWMNRRAKDTLDILAPLYDLPDAKALIGKSIDFFHTHDFIQNIDKLKNTYRVEINIKNEYIAETALTPVYNKNNELCAYFLILFDMTSHAKSEDGKERLIEQLSVPILNVWEDVYVTPLIGDIKFIRPNHLLSKILHAAVNQKAEYFLIDVSGLTTMDDEGVNMIHKITEGLQLVGTHCLVVGVTPNLAKGLMRSRFAGRTYLSIKTALEELLLQNKVQQF